MSKSKNTKVEQAIQASKNAKSKSAFWEYTQAIIIAVILALFIRGFVVQAFKIPSGSMLETLQIGDQLLVNKFVYGLKLPVTDQVVLPIKNPKHGDVIVFEFPMDQSKDYIKRVIGVPGDVIEIVDKKVYRNGEPLDEPYTRFTDHIVLSANVQPRDNFGPIKVPEGKLFVMGDNRDQSYDSRFWGYVDIKKVRGKAFIIHWSWDPQKFGVRWDRLLKWVH